MEQPPDSMRAVVVEGPGRAALRAVPVPHPAPFEVLVRVAAVGICGSDLELFAGTRPEPFVRYPIIPGHEWAGVVVATGEGVTSVRPGDSIVAEGIRPCGLCARCREGQSNLCESGYEETGFTVPGAFAPYLTVPETLIHRLPAGTDLEVAALIEPAACVASGLTQVDQAPDLAIAVLGAGTLGLLAVGMLALTGPRRLVALDIRPERLDLARRMGAPETWNVADGDPRDALGTQFDLVFEASGHPNGPGTAFQLARRGGTVVVEGIVGGDGAPTNADLIPLRQLRVQGVFGGSPAGWTRATEAIASARLDPRPLITHRFPLSEYEHALATLRDPDAGAVKVLLIPEIAA